MKILQVVHDFLPKHQAGTEVYTYNLACELSKKHTVHVYCRENGPFGGRFWQTEEEYGGLKVRRVYYNVINSRLNNLRHFFTTFKNRLITDKFETFLKEFDPDIVHIQSLPGLPVSIISAARRKGIPVVLTLSDYWFMCYRTYLLKRNWAICSGPKLGLNCFKCLNMEYLAIFGKPLYLVNLLAVCFRFLYLKNALKKVDLLVAPSRFLREVFIRYGIPQNKITYCDYGMKHYKLCKRQPSRKIRFGFIGSIMKHKGLDILVDAFNEIRTEKAELKIYGDPEFDPEYYREVKEKVRNRNVHFMGRFENRDLEKVFSEIDVLVVPSIWYENSPLTIHEAFLARIPVITSNIGGMAELVNHRANGLLFRVGESGDLLRKISYIIEVPELIVRLRQNIGRIKTIEENADELERVYSRLAFKRMYERLSRGSLDFISYPGNPPEEGRKVKVSIVILTKNEEKNIRKCLTGIFRQEIDDRFELIVIDSGSRDKTLDIVKEFPVRLVQIRPEDFNHGATRNYAVQIAKGDYVVSVVADAYPVDSFWLKSMIDDMDKDDLVAGVYSRQIPQPDCSPIEANHLNSWITGGSQKIVSSLGSAEQFESLSPQEKREFSNFDNISSCLRKRVVEKIPIPRSSYGEDILWALQVLKAGYKIAYEPNSMVYHSHRQPLRYVFRRRFVDQRMNQSLFDLILFQNRREVLFGILTDVRKNMKVIFRSRTGPFKKLGYLLYNPLLVLAQILGAYLASKQYFVGRRLFNFIDRIDKSEMDTFYRGEAMRAGYYIGGRGKRALKQFPPSKIDYKVRIPQNSSLEFSIATPSEYWFSERAETVNFKVLVKDGDKEDTIFSNSINPRSNREDRRWHVRKIGLTCYAGKRVTLSFLTELDGSDHDSDVVAAWGEPCIISTRPTLKQRMLLKLRDKLVQIIENKQIRHP